MKIPRDLSGRAVVKALCKHWDYRQVHQEVVISSCKQINRSLNASRFQITVPCELVPSIASCGWWPPTRAPSAPLMAGGSRVSAPLA